MPKLTLNGCQSIQSASFCPQAPSDLHSSEAASDAGRMHPGNSCNHVHAGPDIDEQVQLPTAAIIPAPQPAVGVLIHPSSDAILTTGRGRGIGVLAPGTRSETTAQVQARAAAAERARQEEVAAQRRWEQRLQQMEREAAEESASYSDSSGYDSGCDSGQDDAASEASWQKRERKEALGFGD